MKILFTSDFHRNFPNLMPIRDKFDLLVICGDLHSYFSANGVAGAGELRVYKYTLQYIKEIGKPYFLLKGNHDTHIDDFKGLDVINNEFTTGKFHFTPWTNLDGWCTGKTEEEQEEIYSWIIAQGVRPEILVSHQPPFGILDGVNFINGPFEHIGSKALLKFVTAVRPKVHVFGHAHEGFGMVEIWGTKFMNVAFSDRREEARNKVIVYDDVTGLVEMLSVDSVYL